MNTKLMEPGKWYAEFDGNGVCTAAVCDASCRRLLGFASGTECADVWKSWTDSIHPDDAERLNAYLAECLGKHPEGMDFDIEYRMMTGTGYHWFHDHGNCARRADGSVARCDGVVFDIQEGFDKVQTIRHQQLRGDVLAYLTDHDDDPVELLKTFAERLRVLIDCDQVIYRDLEETRIMVNSPEIEKTWAVPIEYCRQCEHFDAHHPMYKDGYTEMSNCQEGWRGIPVYGKCPIKSSLTRIVYCDGEAAGYLAIHYVTKYHDFTDTERTTLEEFTRILSLSLSRFEAKRRAGELNSVRKTMSMTFALSDQFDPIIVLDPETGEYDWMMSVAEDVVNNTSMTLHGDDLYKNIGLDSVAIIHEEDKERFRAFYTRENMLKIARTGETQEIENRWFIQTEGRYKWKYNKAVRMIDENGKAYVVIGVVDTTEKRENEARLATRTVLSEYLLRSYRTAFYTDLNTGEITVLQSSAWMEQKIAALSAAGIDVTFDFLAATYARGYVHPDDREKFLAMLDRESIRRQLAAADSAGFTFRDNSAPDPCVFRCTIIRGADDDHIAAGFQDISAEVRQQEEQQQKLQKAYIAADAANRAKSAFLFNMSHDIRTPMNAIRGFTAMAKKNAGDGEKVIGYLEKIDTSGQQLLTLINQVLEMARIESGKTELALKPVEVRAEFGTMVTVLEEQARSKGLEFRYSLSGLEHNHVLADVGRMSSVTLNITGNAMKYTPEGGRIDYGLTEIPARKPGFATFVFTVADTGIGMSREYIKELYEPFSREKSSTVSKIQGTGLGMAIVKSMVDLMDGTIEVQSEPGKGTRFDITIDFPVDENAEPDRKAEEDIKEVSFKGLRVLLVEDNEMNREIAKDILEEQGLIVEEAEDGDVAVAKVRETAGSDGPRYYDFVLMDIQMPRMNGYEAAKAIRAMYPGAKLPIIALSANAFAEDKAKSLEAGMNDHVAKPIDVNELFISLAKYI